MKFRPLHELRARLRQPLLRDVATVASGTVVAQAITFAATPLITRIYGPEALGLQGIFVSMVGLVVSVAALTYPTAIVLPKAESDAAGLARLSVCLAIASSVVVFAALLISGDDALRLVDAEALGRTSLLVPVSTLFIVITSVFANLFIRDSAFRVAARITVLSAVILNGIKIGFGLTYASATVLIVANTCGTLVNAVAMYVAWRARRPVSAPGLSPSLWGLAKNHRDFALLRTPQNLINAASQSLPLLLLARFFGAHAAGQYALAIAVMSAPTMLIGSSVASVFYPRVTEAVRRNDDVRTLIINTTTTMALVGAVPYLVVLLAGPSIFAFLFGESWRSAGSFAQLLSPWIFLQYLNRPAVAAIPALGLQGGLLAYEIFSTGSKVVALWVGFALLESELWAVGLFSLVGVTAYVWLIVWTIRRSGRGDRVTASLSLGKHDDEAS